MAALGRGLRQFLGEIERVGHELVRDEDGSGLRPWLVAGAASAAACEIARRQLKRYYKAAVANDAGRADGSQDRLFVG
jgi:hypothetical protein